MSNTKKQIDFVISWVDGQDREWKAIKKLYQTELKGVDDREVRYRDWDILRYWFRGVEEFAPWVGKIHFVTWGHIPNWLDVENPKINIVNHRDILAEEFLPTFNSNAIELNLHRIPGLSQCFVYFNDDVFLTGKVCPEDFFIKGLPCDMLALQPVVVKPDNTLMAQIYLNNMIVLSKYFNKRKNILSQPQGYFKLGYPLRYVFYNLLELSFPLFTGMMTLHGPAPLRKKTYDQLWEKEKEVLAATCRRRFRSGEDVNQYLFREWQKLSGKFYAKNVGKNFGYFELADMNDKLTKAIKKKKFRSICINDTRDKIDIEKVKKELGQAFEEVLPDKSRFELY